MNAVPDHSPRTKGEFSDWLSGSRGRWRLTWWKAAVAKRFTVIKDDVRRPQAFILLLDKLAASRWQPQRAQSKRARSR
ncbi:hypothetical protein KCP75_22120 [Salmonella enterica subsp. enterica]|nr:hypothetical protein KCP75_22120 [Salmonella enterica subsp. enterica]